MSSHSTRGKEDVSKLERYLMLDDGTIPGLRFLMMIINIDSIGFVLQRSIGICLNYCTRNPTLAVLVFLRHTVSLPTPSFDA